MLASGAKLTSVDAVLPDDRRTSGAVPLGGAGALREDGCMAETDLTSWLDGTFFKREEPSTVYLVRLKNHPSFFKLGFCQVRLRKRRYGA